MRAILIKDISFLYLNKTVFFKTGTEVIIDLKDMVALADQIHFDINKDEYAILQ